MGMSRTLLLTLLFAGPVAVLAESAMPSIGYAGALTDHGGQDCSTCHNSFGGANTDSRGSVTADITSYNPGVQQTIHLMVQHPLAQRWGLSLVTRRRTGLITRLVPG